MLFYIKDDLNTTVELSIEKFNLRSTFNKKALASFE
jgi:hypothetical protein